MLHQQELITSSPGHTSHLPHQHWPRHNGRACMSFGILTGAGRGKKKKEFFCWLAWVWPWVCRAWRLIADHACCRSVQSVPTAATYVTTVIQHKERAAEPGLLFGKARQRHWIKDIIGVLAKLQHSCPRSSPVKVAEEVYTEDVNWIFVFSLERFRAIGSHHTTCCMSMSNDIESCVQS